MSKGDTVFYTKRDQVIRAMVRTAHRDGTATVEAMFYQRDGKDVPGFLGFLYRVHNDDLRLAA